MRSLRMAHSTARPHLGAVHHDRRLAESIQMSPSANIEARHLGVVAARRHATGWFIAARHRHNLSVAQLNTFREFVTVRIHKLLSDGPQHGGWTRAAHDEWLNHSTADRAPADAQATPDTLPPR